MTPEEQKERSLLHNPPEGTVMERRVIWKKKCRVVRVYPPSEPALRISLKPHQKQEDWRRDLESTERYSWTREKKLKRKELGSKRERRGPEHGGLPYVRLLSSPARADESDAKKRISAVVLVL